MGVTNAADSLTQVSALQSNPRSSVQGDQSIGTMSNIEASHGDVANEPSAPDTREVPRLAAAERSLRRACRSADPSAAVDALCEIGRARWTETPPLSA